MDLLRGDLHWATHTGATLRSTPLVRPVPSWKLGPARVGFCSLSLCCAGQRNSKVKQLMLNGVGFILPTSSSLPPHSNALGNWGSGRGDAMCCEWLWSSWDSKDRQTLQSAFWGEVGKFSKSADFARGGFFLVGLHGNTLLLEKQGSLFSWNRNWSLLCLSGERHNSEPKAGTEHSNVKWKKERKCLQQQTESLTAEAQHSTAAAHRTPTEVLRLRHRTTTSLMLPTSSRVLGPSAKGETKPLTAQQLQVSPDFLLSVTWNFRNDFHTSLRTPVREQPLLHWDRT